MPAQRTLSATLLAAQMGLAAFIAFGPVLPAKAAGAAKYNQAGELVRPQGYREWIYMGAPLTPNDMNNGKAAFPEFHNVYIDPASYQHWKKTGTFRDGTVIMKELVSVGSKQTASGNGYFMGEYIGLEAMVKDARRFGDQPGNWGFFRFTDEKNYDFNAMKTHARANPAANCASCHQASAKQDMVFIQHYPVLRASKP